ncbi:MAG: hypothetical protein RLZZ271_1476, partial [Pseudomonadota bacterium]
MTGSLIALVALAGLAALLIVPALRSAVLT